ncbi:MAG: pantoate--beta-alanine ligase [Xanthomonadales bacterium]|nr:pantoate--beta-alanine ligase [Xanthomonadales bacterium]
MKVVRRRGELYAERRALRSRGALGFVPTMGNLHAGHLALVDLARAQADRVAVSIFVNPTQFGPGEDYAAYPRTFEADLDALGERGCDLVFAPEPQDMYPYGADAAVTIDVPEVSEGLCAASRPGHFAGVATAVTRLFAMVQPDLAVFGEKDYQQLLVIRRLVADLGFPISVIGAPIVREPDGLAMSSRNAYLTPEERRKAPALYAALSWARDEILAGRTPDAALTDEGMARLCGAGLAPEYFEVRRAADLGPVGSEAVELVILGAVRVGSARLIDNCRVASRGA